MDIRRTIIKSREQKADIRHFHDPVPDPVLYMIRLRIIAKPGLGELHRTDTAKQEFIHLIRCIKHLFPIGRFSRHIVVCVDQNNIIILPIIIKINDFLIKLIQKRIVLKLTVPQTEQKLLSTAKRLLLQRKLHIHQILPNASGKRLFKQIKIFKHFFLRKRKECIFRLRFYRLFPVHITAADSCDGTVGRRKLFFNFCNFFFIHVRSPR